MRLFFTFVLIICLSDASIAALGQAANAGKPSRTLGYAPIARIASIQTSLYKINETVLETGTTVREFASANGVVFAVAWRGPVLPDLNELFGNYFKSFRVESERIRASGRRASTLNVDFEGLLVQSSGRMRDFFGYAFVPTLVPQGVVINDLVR